MKTPPLLHLGVGAFVLGAAAANAETKLEYRDAATHDDLVKVIRSVQSAGEAPFLDLKEAKGEDPSKLNKPGNLLERSDIISYGSHCTLVPKRAIIHLPESISGVKGHKPGTTYIPWNEFLLANRAWIKTHEVDRNTANGTNPIPEESWEAFRKGNKLIVATMKGGPISVLPPKEVEEPEEAEGEVANLEGGKP